MNNDEDTLKLEVWLPDFFFDYQRCREQSYVSSKKVETSLINCQELETWFLKMEQPLCDARKGAFGCDPWEIAGVDRDEVRNSAILAWLLNPKGNHGLGGSALSALLAKLNLYFCSDFYFPKTPGNFCFVRTESNPDGDITNRVDIEIDSENFYLLIEVKIDALEGDEQLNRYGRLAESQASDRPWAILFLTVNGRDSSTAKEYAAKVCPLSWHDFSCMCMTALTPTLRQHHASKAASRVMAEQIVRCFVKKIKSF